jgi:hypothetical protein
MMDNDHDMMSNMAEKAVDNINDEGNNTTRRQNDISDTEFTDLDQQNHKGSNNTSENTTSASTSTSNVDNENNINKWCTIYSKLDPRFIINVPNHVKVKQHAVDAPDNDRNNTSNNTYNDISNTDINSTPTISYKAQTRTSSLVEERVRTKSTTCERTYTTED